MNIIYDLSEKHIVQLHSLFQEEWWTKNRSLADTRSCVVGSQIRIGLVSEKDELLGFARVLTDYTFKAFIFDVIVAKKERGKGLGNQLLSLIRNHEKVRQVKHFELYCLPEMFSFYEKRGFTTDIGKIRLMRLINT